ncbi:hypothetical protein GCM10027594_11560 [Hymenobacter agri]
MPVFVRGLVTSVVILLINLSEYNWDFVETLMRKLPLLLAINGVVVITAFVTAAPLYFFLNEEARTVRYFTLIPLRKVLLDAARIECTISNQTSHSGTTHFLLLHADGSKMLSVQATERWPLAKLEKVQQAIEKLK